MTSALVTESRPAGVAGVTKGLGHRIDLPGGIICDQGGEFKREEVAKTGVVIRVRSSNDIIFSI